MLRTALFAVMITLITLAAWSNWKPTAQSQPDSIATWLNRIDSAVDVPESQIRSYPRPYRPEMKAALLVRERRVPQPMMTSKALSTFSIDVDTASYAAVRKRLLANEHPSRDSVRAEELINYFDYDYPRPLNEPFAVVTKLTENPWRRGDALLSIGIQARAAEPLHRQPVSLIFLVDTSGSMDKPDRLPLLRESLGALVDALGPDDRLALVTYAGNAHVALPPTEGDRRATLQAALDTLSAGGGTSARDGLETAYRLARQSRSGARSSRVILATDGALPGNRQILADQIRVGRQNSISLSVLRVGNDPGGDALLNDLARGGDGSYHYLSDLTEAERVLGEQVNGLLDHAARDVKIQLEFNSALVESYRLVGYADRVLTDHEFEDDAVDAGDLGVDQQVTALYEIDWKAPGRQPSKAPVAILRIRYKLPGSGASELLFADIRRDHWVAPDQRTPDLQVAVAAAGLGRLLRGEDIGDWDSRQAALVLRSRTRRDDELLELADLLELAAMKDIGRSMLALESLPLPPGAR